MATSTSTIRYNPSKTKGIKQVFINNATKHRAFYFITQNPDGTNMTETLFNGSTLLEHGIDSIPHVYWLNDDYFITSPTDSLYGCCMVHPPGYRVYYNQKPIMELARDDYSGDKGCLNPAECKVEDRKIIICRTFYSELDEYGMDYVSPPINNYETYDLNCTQDL